MNVQNDSLTLDYDPANKRPWVILDGRVVLRVGRKDAAAILRSRLGLSHAKAAERMIEARLRHEHAYTTGAA